mgnify:CR=1 FL=1
MICIWIRKILMSPRAVFVLMILGIILILFAALWGLSFIWEPSKYIMWFLALVLVYIVISENLSWDISKKVNRINSLVDNRKYHKALEKYDRILQKGIITAEEEISREVFRTIKYGQGRCFLEIGVIDGKPETFYKAIECFEEVLRNYPKENDSSGFAQILANLGAAYRNLGDVTESEATTIRAIEVLNEANATLRGKTDLFLHSYIQSQLGLAYESLAKFRDKFQNLNKSVCAFTEAKNIYLSKKRFKDAFYIDIYLGRVIISLIQEESSEKDMAKAIKSLEDGIGFLSVNKLLYKIEHMFYNKNMLP